jgi:hypothetical protein
MGPDGSSGSDDDGTSWTCRAVAREEPEQLIADLTDALGEDVVIEAVGVPESVELRTRTVRPRRPRRHRCPASRRTRRSPSRRPDERT